MKHCNNCQFNSMNDSDVVCPRCGTPFLLQESPAVRPSYYSQAIDNRTSAPSVKPDYSIQDTNVNNRVNSVEETNPIGCLGQIVAFWYPILGIAMYIIWKESSPKSANKALKWAIIPTLIIAGLTIFYAIISFSSIVNLLSQIIENLY